MLVANLGRWTTFVEAVEPEELMRVLDEFHGTIGALVRRFDATVCFSSGRRRPTLLQRPDRDAGRRRAGRAPRLRVAARDVRADAAVA
jgi:hypothetical protein